MENQVVVASMAHQRENTPKEKRMFTIIYRDSGSSLDRGKTREFVVSLAELKLS
ncbi:hypothetical protein ACONDI_01121 [Natranaerofaba carboxydovora]|nr:hypothetical protein ACONDI_01121 [Natranaerofaba carboxydovora]